MSILESSARKLATALDALEAKLDEQLAESAGHRDFIDAARRQARVARTHTGAASRELSRTINDIKAILRETHETNREQVDGAS
ncbi:MAG: hypothetical protein ACE5FO_12860 [Parvularculaceae bacterium]